MKRSTVILGFALLVVAATLAITITFRNDPGRGLANRAATARQSTGIPVAHGQPSGRTARLPGRPRLEARRTDAHDRREVTIPVQALEGLSSADQAEFLRRADAVERGARRKLERMTEEFELTSSQRAKMYPLLVRSAPGYDGAMLVGGVPLDADPLTPAGEQVHELLDSDQQARLEDEEVDRQLWWQDVFARIEADLVNSTGGMPIQEPSGVSGVAVDDPAAAGGERVAPTPRRGATR